VLAEAGFEWNDSGEVSDEDAQLIAAALARLLGVAGPR
jgi:hypothetical protein